MENRKTVPVVFYCCLSEGHPGKSCQRSNQCGQNGCLELHHRLLHRQHKRQSREPEKQTGVLNRNNSNHLNALQYRFPKQIISVTEGNDHCTEGNNCCVEGNNHCTEKKDRCTEGKDGKECQSQYSMMANNDYTERLLTILNIPSSTVI